MPPTLTNKQSCIKEKHWKVWNHVKIIRWPSLQNLWASISVHTQTTFCNVKYSFIKLAITCVVGVGGVLHSDLLAVKQTKTHIWQTSDLSVSQVSIPCSSLLVRPGAYESVGKGDSWSVAALLSAISGAWLCCGSALLTVSYPPPPSPAVSAA